MRKGIGVCIIAVGAFFAWFVTHAAVSRDAPKVTVQVINASPIEISSILLTHKSEVVRIEKLAPFNSRTARLTVGGESSYRIVAHFSNGRSVDSGSRYVESGYRVTEIITEREINSDVELSRY
jgi:hypothetical protein